MEVANISERDFAGHGYHIKKIYKIISKYLQNEERSRVLDFLKKLADWATMNFHFPTCGYNSP